MGSAIFAIWSWLWSRLRVITFTLCYLACLNTNCLHMQTIKNKHCTNSILTFLILINCWLFCHDLMRNRFFSDYIYHTVLKWFCDCNIIITLKTAIDIVIYSCIVQSYLKSIYEKLTAVFSVYFLKSFQSRAIDNDSVPVETYCTSRISIRST